MVNWFSRIRRTVPCPNSTDGSGGNPLVMDSIVFLSNYAWYHMPQNAPVEEKMEVRRHRLNLSRYFNDIAPRDFK